jgi:decaprenyl-phosphate phosphoribosyltransferase
MAALIAFWQGMRPRQWVKNLVVLAAPLAAGDLLTPRIGLHALIAVMAFCLASSAGYLINDVVDIESDREHPVKSRRPIASGRLAPGVAIGGAAALAVASLLVALTCGEPRLVLVVAIYLAATISYSLGAKQIEVIDLAIVSAGFVLRAIGGGVATGIPLSNWFLLVASFGSLFMVAGKRYSELVVRTAGIVESGATAPDATVPGVSGPGVSGEATGADGGAAGGVRADRYSASYLRFVWGISAGATIFAYAAWAFEPDTPHASMAWAQISAAPFVLALLRYAVDIDHGRAGAPEDIVLHDRVLQILGVAWLIAFSLAAGVF